MDEPPPGSTGDVNKAMTNLGPTDGEPDASPGDSDSDSAERTRTDPVLAVLRLSAAHPEVPDMKLDPASSSRPGPTRRPGTQADGTRPPGPPALN